MWLYLEISMNVTDHHSTDLLIQMSDSREDIAPNPPRWKPNPDPSSIYVPGLNTSAPIHDQIEQIEQLITIKLQVSHRSLYSIQSHPILIFRILTKTFQRSIMSWPTKSCLL